MKKESRLTNKQLAKIFYNNLIENIFQRCLKDEIKDCFSDEFNDFDDNEADEIYFYLEKFLKKALLIGGTK